MKILLLLLCALTMHAHAVDIAVTAPSVPVAVGNSFGVTVAVSGLTAGAPPGLGAYDIDLFFDPILLSFQAAIFGSGLDAAGLGSIQSNTLGIGRLNLFELSLDAPGDLIAYQGGAFNLVTLTFTAISPGISDLSLVGNALSDALGSSLSATFVGTSVALTPIPEPTAWTLILLGCSLLTVSSRKFRKEQREATHIQRNFGPGGKHGSRHRHPCTSIA